MGLVCQSGHRHGSLALRLAHSCSEPLTAQGRDLDSPRGLGTRSEAERGAPAGFDFWFPSFTSCLTISYDFYSSKFFKVCSMAQNTSVVVHVPRALGKSVPSMLIRPRRGIVLFGRDILTDSVRLLYPLQGRRAAVPQWNRRLLLPALPRVS